MGVLGKANIGGVLQNLTGGGYVNIDGVLRPITIGNFNIDGVLLAGGYTWKKYNTVEKIASYTMNTDSNAGDVYFYHSTPVLIYKSMDFDETTGEFTLKTSMSTSASNAYNINYPYCAEYRSNGGIDKTKVSKITGRNGIVGTGTKLNYKYKRILYYREPVIAYSQGTYIEDVVSPDESAYPENGRHTDGYWYVKQ